MLLGNPQLEEAKAHEGCLITNSVFYSVTRVVWYSQTSAGGGGLQVCRIAADMSSAGPSPCVLDEEPTVSCCKMCERH